MSASRAGCAWLVLLPLVGLAVGFLIAREQFDRLGGGEGAAIAFALLGPVLVAVVLGAGAIGLVLGVIVFFVLRGREAPVRKRD